MFKYGALVVVLALPGIAAAQPGGSDLPVDMTPAATNEPPPAQDMQPAQPLPPEPQGPALPDPANATTRATFVSTSGKAWDVWVDQTAICATPCTLGLTGVNYVSFKTQERHPVRLDVGYLPQGDLMVHGTHMREGMYAGGIVATAFAGMALATGITLTAVGYGTDRSGMKTAGLITGVAGAIGLYGGIYLMRAALPKFSIGPARPYVAAHQAGLAGSF